MKQTKKIIRILFIINVLQLAVGLCTWGYLAKISAEDSNYILLLTMGLILLSSMMILAGLYLALRDSDNRMEESIHNLEELNTTLRVQRHDYLNHFQVIYGLMEMEEYEEARKYLEPVFKDICKVGKVLKTAQPAVNALLQAKMKTAEDNGIEMYLEIRSDLSRIPMEGWNLCKVLSNIIDNGIRALSEESDNSCKKEKWLRIQISEENAQYYICISNNGPQITEEVQAHIFRQGFSTKKEEGHGMGLYIVSQIVEQAGGHISVQSSPEHTAFHIMLPIEKAGE